MSVKARRKMSKGEKVAAFKAMRTEVDEGPCRKTGICVLFLIGLDNPDPTESGFYDGNGTKAHTPIKLAGSIWNFLVVVPSDDCFGLSDVVTQTTLDGDAQAEVYTSHGLLHPYSREEKTVCDTLLRTKAIKHSKEFVYLRDLCEAFGRIDKDAGDASPTASLKLRKRKKRKRKPPNEKELK